MFSPIIFDNYTSPQSINQAYFICNHSTIFKTITNDITGVTKSISIFNSTLATMKKNIKNGQSITYSIFNGNKLNQKDVQSIINYSNALKNGASLGDSWNKNMASCSVTAKQYVLAARKAGKSTDEMITGLSQIPKTAKAGKIALQALATAGNILMMMGIFKGIELTVKGIDNLIHSAEHCKERVDDLMSSYKSEISTLNDNKKTISELTNKYNELSKGVGNLGNNISLTEGEFEEYHNITSKIADMYPSLVDGWDTQGNAIVNLTDSVKELNAEYEKSLHNANLKLMESKEDIFKNYKNTIDDINKSISYAEKALDIIYSGGDFYDVIYDNEGYKTSYYKAFENLGLSVNDMISGNVDTLEKQISLKILSLKDEMETATQEVTPLLKAYLSEDIDYQSLSDERLKTALSLFINNLPSALVTDITNNGIAAGSSFIQGFIDEIKNNSKAKEALIQLSTIDLNEVSINKAKDIIDESIPELMDILNSVGYEIDPIELKIKLGIDIIDDSKKRLDNSIHTITDNNGVTNQIGYSDLIKYTKEFKREQIELWLEATRGAKSSAQAIQMYEDRLVKSTDESLLSFEEIFNSEDFADSKEKLLDLAISGEITAEVLQSTEDYKKLLTETGLSAEGAKGKILDLLSVQERISGAAQGFDSLMSAYKEFKDEDIGFVTAQTLESLPDAFKELEGFNIFSQIAGDPTSGAEQIQNAFNEIAAQYLMSQDTLNGLINASQHDIQSYIANLKQMGVTNAEELVTNTLKALKQENELINAATKEYYEAYLKYLKSKDQADLDYVQSIADKNSQLAGALGKPYQTDYNNWCELLKKKAEAYNEFVTKLGGSLDKVAVTTAPYSEEGLNQARAEAIVKNAKGKKVLSLEDLKNPSIKNTIDTMRNLGNVADYSKEQVQAAEKYLETAKIATEYKDILKLDLSLMSTDFSSTFSPDVSDSSSKKDKDKDTKETLDWIEIKIQRLTELLDKLKTKADNTYASWTSRNTALAQAIDKTYEAINLQSQAYNRYMQEANSMGLSGYYKTLVQNGAVDISTISDETLKDQINEYQTW